MQQNPWSFSPVDVFTEQEETLTEEGGGVRVGSRELSACVGFPDPSSRSNLLSALFGLTNSSSHRVEYPAPRTGNPIKSSHTLRIERGELLELCWLLVMN